MLLFILVQRVPIWLNNSKIEGTKAPQLMMLNVRTGQSSPFPASGKAIYIYWATWCGPCKLEMGRLQSAIDEGSLSAKQVIGISSGESLESIQSEILNQKYSFEFLHDERGESLNAFQVTGTPTVLQINEKGEVVSMSMGIQPFLISKSERFLKD